MEELVVKRVLNFDVENNKVIMSPVGISKLNKNSNDLSKYIMLNGKGEIVEAKFTLNKVIVKVKANESNIDFAIDVEEKKYTHFDENAENTLQLKEGIAREIDDNKILLIGDSLFFNWQNPQKDINNENIINFGVGGFCVSDLISFVFPRLIQVVNPSKILIHVGVNDMFQGGFSLEKYLQDLKDFISLMKEYFPNTQIIFVSIIRPTDIVPTVRGVIGPEADGRRDDIDRANMYMKKYCLENSNMLYIDGEKAYVNDLGRSDPKNFYPDGIHLLEGVYPAWGEIISRYIK